MGKFQGNGREMTRNHQAGLCMRSVGGVWAVEVSRLATEQVSGGDGPDDSSHSLYITN